jgi:uncharacterized protein
VKKILLIIAGNISLSLGIVGIFVPVLPTTPFLLLSAACFLRSSDRLYQWLTGHRIFGAYIRYYIVYRAISVRAKVISVVMLWIVIGGTIVFFIDMLWLRILLIIIAFSVTVFILSRKTLTGEMRKELEGDKSVEGL